MKWVWSECSLDIGFSVTAWLKPGVKIMLLESRTVSTVFFTETDRGKPLKRFLRPGGEAYTPG
jgi:hypothetical protein